MADPDGWLVPGVPAIHPVYLQTLRLVDLVTMAGLPMVNISPALDQGPLARGHPLGFMPKEALRLARVVARLTTRLEVAGESWFKAAELQCTD